MQFKTTVIADDVFTRAFAPMAELVTWRQDRAPHLCGSFRAVVLRCTVDDSSAGAAFGHVSADSWQVHADANISTCADICAGDTLTRTGHSRDVLSVQQVTRDETGWLMLCIAKARAAQ